MWQISFGESNKGSVVSKEEVMEQLLKGFCVGMQSPKEPVPAIKTVVDVYSTVIIKVFYDLFKHHAEKDTEQSVPEDHPVSTPYDNGEGPRAVTVQPNLATLVFTELDNCTEELWGESKVLHDHPQSFSTHCVKHFGQVHKHYIQSFVLLPSFLLELSEDDHYICSVPVDSEPTLGFW